MNQLGGTESKLNAKNAWGRTTGYADELKAKGMVQYDPETGEDMLSKRRQQLENWRNQAGAGAEMLPRRASGRVVRRASAASARVEACRPSRRGRIDARVGSPHS